MSRGTPFRAGLLAGAFSILVAASAHAGPGDCGQPISSGIKPAASDALAILKHAVGGDQCDGQLCICDPNGDQNVNASDALYTLRIAVGQSLALNCPCGESPITVTASPGSFLTDTVTEVRVVAQILPSPGLETDSVRLVVVDENSDPVGDALCTLLDDGNLDNGDDIAGDSVFSCLVDFLEPDPATLRLAVEATISATAVRSVFVLNAVDPLTMEDAELINSVQDFAMDEWDEQSALLGDTTAAREATVDAIEALEGVDDAGISSDGVTIWIEYENGASGGLMLNPEGTRGGPPLRVSWQSSAAATIAAATPPAFERLPQPLLNGAGAAAEPGTVDNNNVLIWDAYNSQFAPFDEGPALQTLFQDSDCPKFQATYLVDGQCDVSSVSTFASYGTVILVTHGAVDGKGQVVFLTRETKSILSILSHGIDLVLGRVTILGDVFAIRPSFISNLSGTFDNSIVYNGSCQSSANDTMAQAFLGKGASNYFAFTRVVNSDFAQSVATQLFTNLVTGGKDSTEAFAPVTPKIDPKAPNATFTHTSSQTIEYTGKLINGDFEKGDLTGWTSVGDGRVVSALGPIAPTGGSHMGLISTGLGFTTESGSIEQSFCLPNDATSLDFSWNFNSEEFIEWCGSSFDDRLTVTLETDEGFTQVLFESVNSLCDLVGATPLFFDQSGPGCVPLGDGTKGSFGNDCKVWGTGWLNTSFDVTALAIANDGKGVTLRFSAGDVGDSIFDTAVLIDDVAVTSAP